MAATCTDCGRSMADGFDLTDDGTRWHVDLRAVGETQGGETVYRCRRCRQDYPFNDDADHE
jgi:hypothetical protein